MGGNPLEQPHESPGKAATIPRALPPPHHPELHLLCLTRFRSNCPLKSARSCKIRFASVHEFYEEHGIGRRGGGERRDEKGMRVPRMSRTGFGSRGQGRPGDLSPGLPPPGPVSSSGHRGGGSQFSVWPQRFLPQLSHPLPFGCLLSPWTPEPKVLPPELQGP